MLASGRRRGSAAAGSPRPSCPHSIATTYAAAVALTLWYQICQAAPAIATQPAVVNHSRSSSAPPATNSKPSDLRCPGLWGQFPVLNTLTTAIYDLQRQMSQFATRLAIMEGRPSLFPSEPSVSMLEIFHTGAPQPPPSCTPFGMPGYDGIPPQQPSPPIVIHTEAPNRSVPITKILFPPLHPKSQTEQSMWYT